MEHLEVSSRLLASEPIQRCDWPGCRAACCVYGTWIDAQEREDLLAHATLIQPHLPGERGDPQAWFDKEQEQDSFTPSGRVWHTRVLEDPGHYGGSACIFLRPDYKCALQVTGQANGLHPWRFKPFYCVLHPLDLDEQSCITLDEIHLLVNEPASCLRRSEHPVKLRELFAEELRYLARGGDQTEPDMPYS